MLDYGSIAAAIESARERDESIAMFWYQVLKHADELTPSDAEELCSRAGMKPRFDIDFRKLLALAKLLKRQGAKITFPEE